MTAEADFQDYLDEIRHQVCSSCGTHRAGGSPGKSCGEAMPSTQPPNAGDQAHGERLGPCLECNQEASFPKCPYHADSDHCPCPMETLIDIILPAVEAVDRRQQQREEEWERLLAFWDD